MQADVWIRTARRSRRVSQRELAALADVPYATVARAEAGRTEPRLHNLVTLLGTLGYHLAVVDRRGRLLEVDEYHERLRDAGGRHFPAHLDAEPTPGYFDCEARPWWGWHSIAWPGQEERRPSDTYWRRDASYERWVAENSWLDAT